MSHLLITGGSGQLGSELSRLASASGASVLAPSRAELDLTRAGDVVSAVRSLSSAREPGAVPVVINAAAYTAVDAAETDERRAFAVNADGPRVLAAACSAERIPLVHVSTDYVFSGDSERAYEPDDRLSPRSAYGRTKAAGEVAVLGSGASAWVVRTSWVYGASGSNFVRTMARLEREQDTVRVVDDQHGSPTSAADLAAGLLQLATAISRGEGPAQRVLHCTGGGVTTWCGFAREIFAGIGADPARVQGCTTAEFPRPARRPARAVLSNASWLDAGFTPLPSWQEALREFFALHGAEL